jgi:ABC-2 type transport system ATP-binding protein
VVEFTGLAELLPRERAALSKGTKQRLCLAKTLLHDPELLILDEPAAGLDPRARIELRELLKALAALGKAILISSHILADLAEICDGVVVIERGKLCAGGGVDEVARSAGRKVAVLVRARAGAEALERALVELPGVLSARRAKDGVVAELEDGDLVRARVLAELVARGLEPLEFASERASLEDVFLSVTRGALQ